MEAIYALTQDRGIDHVIDTVGGPNLGNSVRAVAVGGRISVIGVLAGAEISAPAGLLLLKSAEIQASASATAARWKIWCAPWTPSTCSR